MAGKGRMRPMHREKDFTERMSGSQSTSPLFARLTLALIAIGLPMSAGCAAIAFPMKGTPACCLPVDCLVYPKRNLVSIDYSKLSQPKPDVYRVDSGDVLGVFVEGVLPYTPSDQVPPLPPVQFRDSRDGAAAIPPALGYPVLVQENGQITLPSIGRIHVVGLSMEEITQKIVAKCDAEGLSDKDKETICVVTLINPRTYNITVIREDQDTAPQEHQANGTVIALAAYRNDVLNALMLTGGMPGLLAKNEIRIRRSPTSLQIMQKQMNSRGGTITGDTAAQPIESPQGNAVPLADYISESVIPLRIPAGTELEILPEEVTLYEGDIVLISNRTSEVFYTGGLLPAGEHALPRDYDIDVFEAMAIAGYSFGKSGRSGGGGGGGGAAGLASMSGIFPSELFIMRKRVDGTQYTIRVDLKSAMTNECERLLIAPGDHLFLRYKPREEVANFGVFAFFTIGIRELLGNN